MKDIGYLEQLTEKPEDVSTKGRKQKSKHSARQKRILPGNIIMSDGWKEYIGINEINENFSHIIMHKTQYFSVN